MQLLLLPVFLVLSYDLVAQRDNVQEATKSIKERQKCLEAGEMNVKVVQKKRGGKNMEDRKMEGTE